MANLGFYLIKDAEKIDFIHNIYLKKLNEYCDKLIDIQLGFQHTHTKRKVRWSSSTGLWYYSEKRETRFWDIFGISETQPKENSFLNIIIEINPPINGINRRVQGAFAKDDNENIWILHRGRITITGLKNINVREQTFKNYKYRINNIENDNFILVGNINSEYFVDDLIKFIKEIERIKVLLKSMQP